MVHGEGFEPPVSSKMIQIYSLTRPTVSDLPCTTWRVAEVSIPHPFQEPTVFKAVRRAVCGTTQNLADADGIEPLCLATPHRFSSPVAHHCAATSKLAGSRPLEGQTLRSHSVSSRRRRPLRFTSQKMAETERFELSLPEGIAALAERCCTVEPRLQLGADGGDRTLTSRDTGF